MEADIKMIVTDLDRTLLRPDGSVSAYSVGVLRECRRRGILVAFATARSERSCSRFTDMIGPDAVVSNGGALVRIGGVEIYRATLGVEVAEGLLRSMMPRSSVEYITVETDKGYLVNKHVDETDPLWIEYLPAITTDFTQGLGCDAYKITVQISDDATAYEIASVFPTVAVTPFSGEGWYRFADINADKAHGVRALAAHTGVGMKNIAAFGDDFSDLHMIRECGAGVAVENAIREVKETADYVCGSNDNDGVAKWIEQNILAV